MHLHGRRPCRTLSKLEITLRADTAAVHYGWTVGKLTAQPNGIEGPQRVEPGLTVTG